MFLAWTAGAAGCGAVIGDILAAAALGSDAMEGCNFPPVGHWGWVLAGALVWGSMGAAIGGILCLPRVRRSRAVLFFSLPAAASAIWVLWLILTPQVSDALAIRLIGPPRADPLRILPTPQQCLADRLGEPLWDCSLWALGVTVAGTVLWSVGAAIGAFIQAETQL